MIVRFTPQARREVDAAAAWFESREEGLGVKFYDRIGEAVDKIESNPEGYQVVYKGLRRVGLRQFDDWFYGFSRGQTSLW